MAPEETLQVLAKEYLGSADLYPLIQRQNYPLNKLAVGQEIEVFPLSYENLAASCAYIASQRMLYHEIVDPMTASEIGAGVAWSARKLGLTAYQGIELCRQAVATAEQESVFRFAIGGAGEIGMYQFKLDTVRGAIRQAALKFPTDDLNIVRLLESTTVATVIFCLHFSYLLKQCHNRLGCAWSIYNAGDKKADYVEMILVRYNKVKNLKIWDCGS